jgi:hypothetical protein
MGLMHASRMLTPSCPSGATRARASTDLAVNHAESSLPRPKRATYTPPRNATAPRLLTARRVVPELRQVAPQTVRESELGWGKGRESRGCCEKVGCVRRRC